MRSLYERFRNEILQGEQPDYYDRDELLDIYDYAQDEADVMTQMYVFLVASRLYPDADSFLGERIGFFVSYLDSRAGLDLLSRKGRPDSPLWDVLALGVKHYPGGDPAADMAAFLNKHNRLDPESVIKLIDLLRELDRPDLLASHFDELRKKVEDPQGLLFEAAESFRNAGAPYLDLARDLAEELTEKEPFNIDNWILLSRIQLLRQDAEEAVSAADYAAALDPDYRVPKILRAVGQLAGESAPPDVLDTLVALVHEQPDDPVSFNMLVMALLKAGRKADAVDEYIRLWRADQANVASVLPKILKTGMTPQQRDVVEELVAETFGDDEDKYVDVARILVQQDIYQGAVFVLEAYQRRFVLFAGAEILIGLYYKLKKHEELMHFFKDCCYRNRAFLKQSGVDGQESGGDAAGENSKAKAEPMQLSTTAFLFFASSALICHDYESAGMVADMVLATPDRHYENLDPYERITLRGILDIMRKIKSYAADPESIPDTPGFDPIAEH